MGVVVQSVMLRAAMAAAVAMLIDAVMHDLLEVRQELSGRPLYMYARAAQSLVPNLMCRAEIRRQSVQLFIVPTGTTKRVPGTTV